MEKTEQYVIYCDHHFFEPVEDMTEKEVIAYAKELHSLTGVEVVVKKETVETIWKGEEK